MQQNIRAEAAAKPKAVRKYGVLIAFLDIEDGNRVYWAGERYPRDGYEPDEKRIAYLQGAENAFGEPVITKE